MRKRLKKKMWQRRSAIYFTLSKRGKTYPMPVFSRRLGDFKINKGTLVKWARRTIATHERIGLTAISPEVEVSTVFLGINHDLRYRTPILFETMIFGGEHDQMQWRYTTIKKARRGHRRAVALAEEKGVKV